MQCTHHCSPAGYTTTLILKIIALAHFLFILIWKIVNNFYCNTLYLHQIQFTHHCLPAGYTTTPIMKVIALAHFL